MAITEIIQGRCSSINKEAIAKVYTILSQCQGFQNMAYGIAMEDPKKFYMTINWDSLNDHKKVQEDKVKYPGIIKIFQSICDIELLEHVHFTQQHNN